MTRPLTEDAELATFLNSLYFMYIPLKTYIVFVCCNAGITTYCFTVNSIPLLALGKIE